MLILCSQPRRLALPALVPFQMRSELAAKEIILLQKEAELLEKEQTLIVLKEEVRKERGDIGRSRQAGFTLATAAGKVHDNLLEGQAAK